MQCRILMFHSFGMGLTFCYTLFISMIIKVTSNIFFVLLRYFCVQPCIADTTRAISPFVDLEVKDTE